jgi:Tol biopolymer transport system component
MHMARGVGALAFACALLAVVGSSSETARGAFPGVPEDLIFSSDRDGNLEIYTESLSGRTQVRQTISAGRDVTPAWDPFLRGFYLFSTDEDGDWDIHLGKGSQRLKKLVSLPGADTAPAPSPRKSKSLAFEHREGRRGDIYVLGLAGAETTPKAIASSPADDGAPSWSAYAGYKPSGSPPPVHCGLPAPMLVFHSDRAGTYDIWLSSENGASVRPLTSGIGNDFNPNWSPDCRSVVFERRRNNNYDIWTVDVSTGKRRPLIATVANETDPVWAPDGTHLAYVSDAAGNYEIRVADIVQLAGQPQVSATQNVSLSIGSDTAPDWQPELPPNRIQGNPVVPPAPKGGRPTCTKTGTRKANVLKGTAGRDVLCGMAGADVLKGFRGNDVLIGGRGKDVFRGGRGKDLLDARDGMAERTIAGGDGRDTAVVDDVHLDVLSKDVEDVLR